MKLNLISKEIRNGSVHVKDYKILATINIVENVQHNYKYISA